MKDSLGLRGFAQVIPNQGNIYAMSRLAEQKRQSDRDYQLKREEQFGKVYEDFSKGLALEKMRPELMSAQQELFKQTYESGSKAYEQAMKTGDFNASRQFLNEAKLNYDQFKAGLMSIDGTVGEVQKLVMENKDKVFDPKQFGKKWTEISDRLFIRNNGKIVGFDKEAMGDLNSILDSPDIYNKQNRLKSFIGNLADKQISKIRETGSYTQVDSVKTKEGIFQFDKNGDVKTDKNGIPVVNVTPQFVQDFVSDDVNRKWALEAASEVAPPGENPEKYLKEGIEKLIQNHVPYSEEIKSRSYKPEWMVKQGQEKATDDIAFNILEGIVTNKDKSALDQLSKFTGDDIKVEYASSTVGPEGGSPFTPNKVLVRKRETVPEASTGDPLLDALNSTKSKKKEWVTVAEFDLSNYEEAMSGLSKVLEATGGFDKGIGARMFDRIKKSQIELGF